MRTISWRITTFISIWLILLMPSIKPQAAGKYTVTLREAVAGNAQSAESDQALESVMNDDSGNKLLTVTYKGSTLKDTYLALKRSGDKYDVVKPGTKKSKLYYFDSEGFGTEYTKTGFVKISYDGKKKEYYSKKGVLQKDKIVGSKNTGYAYVDSTGIRIKDKTVQYAVKFVAAHTKPSDKRSVKLRKCYTYLYTHYPYKRYYTGLYPTAKDMSKYGRQMFKEKKGNCHRYAICFAYIARVLGYDSKVAVGVCSARGGGWTPHGWALIKNGKAWYVCDPDMELHHLDSYMKTSTTITTKVTRTCKLTIKNGKVTWK